MYDCQVNCKAHVALPTILHTIHLAYTEFPIVWTTLLKVRVPTGQLASTHDCHVSVMRTVFGFCNHEWWTGRLWLSKYLQSQMYLFPQCYKPKTQCWGWCMYLLLRASQFYRKPLHGQTLNMTLNMICLKKVFQAGIDQAGLGHPRLACATGTEPMTAKLTLFMIPTSALPFETLS